MQKQFEEDKAFGKASGWKYASKSQKEKRARKRSVKNGQSETGKSFKMSL